MLRPRHPSARTEQRAVPPTPGMMPRPVSGKPSRARGLTTRKSAPSASSSPPPRAAPSMAATTGTGRAASDAITPRTASLNFRMSAGVCAARSFRSAPAQNVPASHTFSEVLKAEQKLVYRKVAMHKPAASESRSKRGTSKLNRRGGPSVPARYTRNTPFASDLWLRFYAKAAIHN